MRIKETWKDIKGYKNIYQVSNLGRIKSLPKYKCYNYFRINEIILKQCKQGKPGHGYYQVVLHKNKIGKGHLVHRLIAEAFIKNTLNKKTVNHKDGNKLNNNLDNLEWMTQSENCKHAYAIGLTKINKNIIPFKKGSKHLMSKLTEKDVLKIRSMKNISAKELAVLFNITYRNIKYILNGKTWSHI